MKLFIFSSSLTKPNLNHDGHDGKHDGRYDGWHGRRPQTWTWAWPHGRSHGRSQKTPIRNYHPKTKASFSRKEHQLQCKSIDFNLGTSTSIQLRNISFTSTPSEPVGNILRPFIVILSQTVAIRNQMDSSYFKWNHPTSNAVIRL